MKLIRLLPILLISSISYAQVTLESCSSDAIDFLSELTTPKSLSTDCYSLIEGTRNHINEDNSSDNYVEVTGYKNILYTKVYTLDTENNIILDAQRITAGHKTKIKEILAVDFLEDNAKVYVLDKNGSNYSILSFIYNVSGNLTPSRHLKSNELSLASNLTADFQSKKLYVVSKHSAWIKVFNLRADPRGKKAENSSNLLNSISGNGSSLQAPIDIKVYGSEMFILDSDRVLVFNITDNGITSPKRSIAGSNTQISGAQRLEINSSGQLEIINSDNSIKKFNLSGYGNIPPL